MKEDEGRYGEAFTIKMLSLPVQLVATNEISDAKLIERVHQTLCRIKNITSSNWHIINGHESRIFYIVMIFEATKTQTYRSVGLI